MEIERAVIPDVLILRAKKHGDHRGFFSETFRLATLKEAGVDLNWVQDNHSFSASRGVVRGLHFQRHPRAQAKLLRVVRGAVLDVAVDLRSNSPTYGKHVAVELSEANWTQIYVPIGFAHGFCTLTEGAEVLYKVSAEYGPSEEGGLLWNDPDLGIDWPVDEREAILTERDRTWPSLRDLRSPF
ncbi:MAG: dTDP-4-dehydrorhamnose 3,5-epimerase [Hyphomonadaceae bacterium]|nr:dTDP-4-dehydrorhamnose 3,5-epimerase [Hyphomonadaceae bacterium]